MLFTACDRSAIGWIKYLQLKRSTPDWFSVRSNQRQKNWFSHVQLLTSQEWNQISHYAICNKPKHVTSWRALFRRPIAPGRYSFFRKNVAAVANPRQLCVRFDRMEIEPQITRSGSERVTAWPPGTYLDLMEFENKSRTAGEFIDVTVVGLIKKTNIPANRVIFCSCSNFIPHIVSNPNSKGKL